MRGQKAEQINPGQSRKLSKTAEKVSNRRFATRKHAQGIYSFSLSGALACDYILATGHSRGCPAGTGCDKRQTGKRKKKALRI